MKFIRNYNRPWEDEWHRHIQNVEYVNEISSIISSSSEQNAKLISALISREGAELQDSLAAATEDQISAMNYCTDMVCGELTSGLEIINSSLQSVRWDLHTTKGKLDNLSNLFDWKLSLLIEHQQLTNILLEDIGKLLRVPDIQKERQYHIEKGIKFLLSALTDNQFYDDAFRNFKDALEREPTDYFVWYKLGLIYFHSPEHCNIHLAKECFVSAAKYNLADRLALGAENQPSFQIDIGAKANLFAAWCCYVLKQYPDTVKYAGAALAIQSEMLGALYIKASALCSMKKGQEAAVHLEKAIYIERIVALTASFEPVFAGEATIVNLLEQLRKKETNRAIEQLQYCRNALISGSVAEEFFKEIESLVKRNDYLSSRLANDKFNEERTWTFAAPGKDEEQIKHFENIIYWLDALRKIKYCNVDGKMVEFDRSKVLPHIEYINKESQWLFPKELGVAWSKAIIPKTISATLRSFLDQEKQYNRRLKTIAEKTSMEVKIIQKYNEQHLRFLIEQGHHYQAQMQKIRVENDRRRQLADNRNLTAAILYAVLYGIGGMLVGAVVAAFVGGITVHIFNIFMDEAAANNMAWVLMGLIVVASGVFVAIKAFKKRRKNLNGEY